MRLKAWPCWVWSMNNVALPGTKPCTTEEEHACDHTTDFGEAWDLTD